jgi:hypothetical protein
MRNAYLAGLLSVDGSTTLGDSNTDTVSINGTISTSLVPTNNNAVDLGSSSVGFRDLFLAGDATVNGGDVLTTAATANIFNANATTVNFAGAATSLIAGAITGAAVIRNPTVVFATDGSSATPAAATLRAQNGVGTNITAANLIIQGGAGTGTGNGGEVVFQYATAGSSGASTNVYATKMNVGADINMSSDQHVCRSHPYS